MTTSKKSRLGSAVAIFGLSLGFSICSGYFLYSHYQKQPVSIQEKGIVMPRHFRPDDERMTGADKLLMHYPDKIPSADLRKFLTPNSKYVVVHLRQREFVDVTSQSDNENVAQIQGDIYTILSYLHDSYGLRKVYAEGIVPENKEIFDLEARLVGGHAEHPAELIKEISLKKARFCDGVIAAAASQLLKAKQHSSAYEEYMESMAKARQPSAREPYLHWLNERLRVDAVFRLASEEKLEVLPSEALDERVRAELKARILMLGPKGMSQLRDAYTAIFEDRENIFLRIVASREDPLAVVVFGALHAWGGTSSFGEQYSTDDRTSLSDNIYLWNKKNHDKRMSLIEITPASYTFRPF
jgi:hypothetical protein